MKANFGMIVVDGRGKIGNKVASRNKFGAYFRAKVTPANPMTPDQDVVRNKLRSVNEQWFFLSDEERMAWSNMAVNYKTTNVFGKTYIPSGYMLWQKLNMQRSNVGLFALYEPPMPEVVNYKEIATLQYTGSPVGLSLTRESGPLDNVHVMVFATPGLSIGKNFVKSEYRLIQVRTSGAGLLWPLRVDYEAKFGVPSPGSKVFVKLKYVNSNTGQAKEVGQKSIIIPF